MADAQEQKKIVVTSILRLYENTLGTTTSKLYENFYQDKDVETIMLSAHELLDEFMGRTRAQEELKRIYDKADLTLP
jgi:hypothetical protein